MEHERVRAVHRHCVVEEGGWDDSPASARMLAVGTQEIEKLPPEADDEIIELVHDLKNPLTTIALEMCLLESRLDDPDTRKTAARVLQNVAYLERMIQEMLDAGAIHAGALDVQRQPTNLRVLVESVVERSVASRDLHRVLVDMRVPVMALVDELRIERVLANLIQNSLKYSAGLVVVRLERLDDVARLSVSDAGPGIPAGEQQRVFEKYRRAPTSHGQAGHGLGLYVSRRIVEAHGGEIGVESEPGRGCCFYVLLPLTA